MKFNITAEELNKYFRGFRKHSFYEETVRMAKEIAVHATGDYPAELIDERRPTESPYIKDYRKKIWEPITQESFAQVLSELMKIRKADDWSVKYDPTKVPASIKDGESLFNYCEENFPHFTSVTNWTFTVLLQCYLVDSNSLLMVMPMEEAKGADFRRPFPFWFSSEQVVEFIEEEFCIIRSRDKSNYTEGDVERKGEVYYVVDSESFARYEQSDATGSYNKTIEYQHGLGYMPAFKLKGAFKKADEKNYLWQSRIAVMVPRLNEAVREYSDLQAAVVQHMHPQKWMMDTQNCVTCGNTGKVRQGNPPVVSNCPTCGGKSGNTTSPFNDLIIRRPKMDEKGDLPNPPAGYITFDTEIVKIQDERVDKHIYKAMCSVNMQYLDHVPTAQSGIAKEVDRDSLNTFVNSVAEDIVAIMDRVYKMICDWRYKDVQGMTVEVLKEMLPKIAVPTKLDILSASYLVDEISKLKTAKVNPIIVNASEIELANKKHNSDAAVRDMLTCVLDLDPLSGISEDDKLMRLQNKGITREDYVISCNIQLLVKKAAFQDSKFYSLDYEKKMDKIKELAADIIKATEPLPAIDISSPAIDPATGQPIPKPAA